ncbi:MAG TPA: hypothetical protein GXZ76_04220 [Clostridiaceae bacterium]|nr:hypothetical protein [Clostridiaceae bacterium]
MDFLDLVKLRHSCRAYTDQPVADHLIDEILAVGGNAPVGRGLYNNLHFTVVQSESALNRIREYSTINGNDRSFGANVLIFVSTNNLENLISYENVACAVDHMALAASNLGLGNCYLYGFIRDMVQENAPQLDALNLPEGYVPLAALAIGYPVQNQVKPPKTELISKVKIQRV